VSDDEWVEMQPAPIKVRTTPCDRDRWMVMYPTGLQEAWGPASFADFGLTPPTNTAHMPRQTVAALAAAAADGPLVEDVECDGCDGGWLEGLCNCDHGVVRIVVHRADPAKAEALRTLAVIVASDDYDLPNAADLLDAAARIIGGES
jgi:hypothetical protein